MTEFSISDVKTLYLLTIKTKMPSNTLPTELQFNSIVEKDGKKYKVISIGQFTDCLGNVPATASLIEE